MDNKFFTNPLPPQEEEKPKAKIEGSRPQSENTISLSEGEILEEVELEEPVKTKTKRPRGRPKELVILQEDKYEILEKYMKGHSCTLLAEEYDVDKSRIYGILNEPEIRAIYLANVESQSDMLLETFRGQNAKVARMIDSYMDEAINAKRISATSLTGLFTVMGILVDKQVKLEEMQLKREELKLKKEEAERAAKNSEGLIEDFTKILEAANTMPPRDVEENKDNKKT